MEGLQRHSAARRFVDQQGKVLKLWKERVEPPRDVGPMLEALTRAMEGRPADAHAHSGEPRAMGSDLLESLRNIDALQRIVLEVLEEHEAITFAERAVVLETFHAFRLAVTREGQVRERQLTQAVFKSEERYLAAVRAAGFAIWDWDLTSERIHWSQNAESLLGRPVESLSQLEAWLEYVHPGDRLRVASGLRGAIDSGKPGWTDTFRYLRRDATFADVLGRGWILYDEAGEPRRVIGGLVDISEQQALERKLAEQVRLTRAIVENAASCLFLLDKKGCTTYLNGAAVKVTGYTLEELRGRPLHEVLHPRYDDGKPFPIADCPIHCEGADQKDHECTFVRKDETLFVASCSVTTLAPSDGGGAVLEFRDITELKASQERLREAVQARDEFLAIASHELRTPLTALQMQIQGMTRGPLGAQLDARLKPRLQGAERSVTRMAEMVNDLLDVSRLSANHVQLESAELDLCELVTDVVGRMVFELKHSGSELKVAMPPQLMGRWDRSRLDQVITNLIGNALKYGEGQPIEVEVLAGDGAARLRVRDHGIGIAPDEHERIFGRFERAVSVRHFGGFGLGLWIVKQLVEAMGGRIRVESAIGEGAMFEVTLPLEPERAP